MSLLGSGVIAIWNDITDEGRANFYEWHDREHIPERVGRPLIVSVASLNSSDLRPYFPPLFGRALGYQSDLMRPAFPVKFSLRIHLA